MLDGDLQLAHGAFQALGFGAQVTQVKVNCRVGETGTDGFFQLFGSLGFLVLGLGFDRLAQMKQDLGVFIFLVTLVSTAADDFLHPPFLDTCLGFVG